MTPKNSRSKQEVPNPTAPSFFDDVMIGLTGVGDLVHVRFKIDQKMKLPGPFYLQDEKTGKIARAAMMPKIGALASRKGKAGNSGYGVFLNPDDEIKQGSLVTFVSGGYKKEHITVT
jgi:hypothetical protein